METLIKADIFFFIASVGFIIITFLFIIALYHLIKILKDFEFISDKLQKGVNFASSNLEDLAKNVNESSIFQIIFGKKRKTKSKK